MGSHTYEQPTSYGWPLGNMAFCIQMNLLLAFTCLEGPLSLHHKVDCSWQVILFFCNYEPNVKQLKVYSRVKCSDVLFHLKL